MKGLGGFLWSGMALCVIFLNAVNHSLVRNLNLIWHCAGWLLCCLDYSVSKSRVGFSCHNNIIVKIIVNATSISVVTDELKDNRKIKIIDNVDSEIYSMIREPV